MKPSSQQRDLIKAVGAYFRSTKRQIEPSLIQAAAREPLYGKPELRNIQVAQNVLRTCMEATFSQMLPYSDITPIELSIRLASYAISVLPIERQGAAIEAMIATLPAAHRKRVSAGIIIKTEWGSADASTPNVPEGRG